MPRAPTRKADGPITTGAMQGDKPTQRIVPASSAPSTFAAATSVFNAGKQAKQQARTTGRPAGRSLPPLDPSQLQVRHDLQLPGTKHIRRGHTKYDAVFSRLTADGISVTGIPIAYEKAIRSAVKPYMRARPELAAVSMFCVRIIDADTCGVWREAKAGQE